MEVQTSLLDNYLQIVKRRFVPAFNICMTVFFVSVVIAFFFKKPSYLAEAKLKFQRTDATSSITGLGTSLGRLEPVVEDNKTNPINTESEVIRSIPVVTQTISKLNLKDDKQKPLTYNIFLKKLTVKEINGTDILHITYKDKNPQTAAQVVNTLIDTYFDRNISTQRTQASAARKFIEKQLPKAELVVSQAELELTKFKEKYKVVALQEEANKAIEIITDLQKQLSDSQSRVADIEAQSKQIRAQLAMNSQQAMVMTSISQTPGVQDILKEIQQLESQLVASRTTLQNDHPQIINLEEKLKSLNELLQQRVTTVSGTTKPQPTQNFQLGELQQQLSAKLVELESSRLGLVSQAAVLYQLQNSYKQRLNNLPRLEQRQRQLERKVQAAQSTYSLLLQKLQESQIAENQNVGNASIISSAEVPQEPITSPQMLYLSAGLLAVLAGLATVYVLEATDKSIKTVDEAKQLLGLTLLGIIPDAGKPKKLLRGYEESPKKALRGYEELDLEIQKIAVRDTPRSPISEAYRMLRANLKFMSADKELKVIVVTSSVPKEGKSTVATNLAVAMAQTERKVLLIDGDLHRPNQHKIWGLTNSQGLSNLIVGQAEIKKAIRNVMDNLDVLTSGVVPPSPASLLDSKRMAALMETFAANYDFVIVDAPSLNVAADAATLGQMADGVLFVVRPGVVDAVNANFAKELLEKSGQNVLGQVVNGVVSQNEPYSYYYFTEEDYPQLSIKKQESGTLVKY